MWLTLGRKTVFVHIYPLLLVYQKQLFKQILFFLSIAAFKHDQKNNLSEYFSARFRDTQFYV